MGSVPETQLVVLFADIVDSTRLYSALGDELAQHVIGEGLQLFSEIVKDNHGQVIKTIGDEIMASFPFAIHAADAALLMLGMLKTTLLIPEVKAGLLKIKIGMHFGPVIEEENDLFGNTVAIASRLVSQGKASQILISKEFKEALPMSYAVKIRLIDRVHLKGFHGAHEIFEMVQATDTEGITMATWDDIPLVPDANAYLNLKFKGRSMQIDSLKVPITLGRSAENQVVIPMDEASRVHARIDWKDGHFVIKDQSLNGTFVRYDDGNRLVLHRQEGILKGTGSIGLGKDMPIDLPFVIQFKVFFWES